jgi:hypothetical protein
MNTTPTTAATQPGQTAKRRRRISLATLGVF